MKVRIGLKDALIIVDMQKDFMPGGALPVPDGNMIIPILNKYIEFFSERGLPIYFTRDWHPENHISFKGFGGVWPPHCVKDTEGAKFHEDLKIPLDNKFIISKGTNRDFDAYSGFQNTILEDLLRERGIRRVFIGGVATDYCVKNTVIGAINLGFQTFLLLDGIKGVNIDPKDSEKAINLMLSEGAVAISYGDIG